MSGVLGEGAARYIDDLFVAEPAILVELRREMEERGLPMIQVPARTGRLLEVLVRAVGARRVLEIGTLGGYSALWIARGLPPDGRIVSLEKDPDHARLARAWVERAEEDERIEVLQGDARALLAEVGTGEYDLVFIDADKESYLPYLQEALRILEPGGIVIADNALWDGRVIDPERGDDATEGIRAFNRALASARDLEATILPVGDGVALGVKVDSRRVH